MLIFPYISLDILHSLPLLPLVSMSSFGGFGGSGGTATSSPTTFGGFGSSPFTSTPSSTTFPTSSFAQPQSSFGGGLFSSSASSSTGGGFSFGSSAAGTSSTFGGFGSFGSSQQSQPSQSTFAFGTSAFPSTSTSASTTSSNPFGSFNTQNTTTGLFGNTPQQQPQQQQGQKDGGVGGGVDAGASSSLLKSLLEVKASYDPTSPLCRFQSMFYNRVADPSKLKSFVPPPHCHPALYQRAVRSNPDPSSLTPSLAVGFEDLRKRLEAQREARTVHEAAVKGIKDSVEEMRSRHWAYTLPLLSTLRSTGEEQGMRVVRIVNRLLVLEARGIPLMDEEREYRSQVERMAMEVQQQGWMEKAKEMQRRVRLQGGGGGTDAATGDAAQSLTAEDREKLRRILQTQTQALEFLVDVVKEDRKLLQTIDSTEGERIEDSQRMGDRRG